jgi:hypothetical protein
VRLKARAALATIAVHVRVRRMKTSWLLCWSRNRNVTVPI